MSAKRIEVMVKVVLGLAVVVAILLVAMSPASRPVFASVPASPGAAAQQFPIMDRVADKIIQKYQNSTCEQLWQEKAASQNKPKSQQEQEAINLLKSDPQMRQAFINKIAAPIANKMFDCGMIP